MSPNAGVRYLLLYSLIMSMLLMTGCGGCSDDSAKNDPNKPKTAAEKKAEEEKQKPKPNFEFLTPVSYPGIYSKPKKDGKDLTDEDRQRQSILNRTKPGHWINVHFPLLANNFNSNGQLTVRNRSNTGKPIQIWGTDFYSYAQRPVSLAKGEWKNLESTLFLPTRDLIYASSGVEYVLSGTTGLPQVNLQHSHAAMHAGEFHILVLTKRPDAFKYVKLLDCVKMPDNQVVTSPMGKTRFYDVVIPESDQPIPLSRNSLTWTTMAFLIWDDFVPQDLDTQQQQALLDWLHFGGQLILSGPDCLDKLQNSFLSPYLPAKFVSSSNLSQSDFQELNDNWSLEFKKDPDRKRTLQIGKDPVLGVNWEVHPDSSYLDGVGDLVVERGVGRGRIVLTRFSMDASSPTTRWQSLSSFFNGCILRKPSRFFFEGDWGTVFRWRNDKASPYDPLLGSTLRYTSRDLQPLPGDDFRETLFEDQANNQPNGFRQFQRTPDDISSMRNVEEQSTSRNENDTWHYGGYKHDAQSGVAGWDDFSGISTAARRALKSAAGIDPPSPAFVLKMLSIYLVVLVPVNWLLFRMIGRVEWAWVAAPIIAIVGAFAVVKMASLDIGFVRSQTQLSILEMHGDYPRGHLTEYSAMYTSLSTRYAMVLDNPTALSLPFAVFHPREDRQPSKSMVRGVRMNQTIDNRLEDFLIPSNFTGMLHTEMMFQAKGTFSLNEDGSKLSNGTELDLSAAGVVFRKQDGTYQFAWIGDLNADASTDLNFVEMDKDVLYSKWFENEQFRYSEDRVGQLWESVFPLRSSVSLNELLDVVDIEKEQLLQALERADSDGVFRSEPDNPDAISKATFDSVMQQMKGRSDELNLGGMLYAIDQSLGLGRGDFRLIAFTENKLSNNQLSPKATQIQRMTMVLVHLRRGNLIPAKPDKNTWIDFVAKSDLEFDLLNNELKESLEKQMEEEEDDNN